MATTKATFTLDPETRRRLERTAGQLGTTKSAVVRAAVTEFAGRLGRTTEAERLRLLRAFDELVPAIPARPAEAVAAELAEIRAARRRGGRRTPAERKA
jgi:hypothetical protein